MIIPFSNSRLVGNRLARTVDGNEIYDLRDPFPFDSLVDAQPIKIQQGDTLHHIAFEYYGDSRLWWAIADFNGIFDPTTELTMGREIIVPPLDAIEAFATTGS